jgi:hypothetical protein
MIAEDRDPGGIVERERHDISQTDFRHQGKQIMIPVRPFPGDIQKQVDLGMGCQRLDHPFAST